MAHTFLVSIEPFKQEIEPGVFLIGAPLGTDVLGFSHIKIRDVNNQEIPTYTCYDPGFGRECPRLPHVLSDETSYGWVVCNGQEMVLKDGEVEKFCYTANPPPLRKIEKDTLRKMNKVLFPLRIVLQTFDIFNRSIPKQCVESPRRSTRSLCKNMAETFPPMSIVYPMPPHSSGRS